MQKGDRVKDDGFLGEGVIVKDIRINGNPFGYMVLWDKTPDVRYNMGENPTLMLKDDLKKLTKPQ